MQKNNSKPHLLLIFREALLRPGHIHNGLHAAAMAEINDLCADIQGLCCRRIGMGSLLDDAVIVLAVHEIKSQREILLAVPVQIAAGIGQHGHGRFFAAGALGKAGEKFRHIMEIGVAVS